MRSRESLIDEAVEQGMLEVFTDTDGVERVRLTEKGFAGLEASFRERGKPIPWLDGPGYRITTHRDGHQSIMCKRCAMVSQNPNDVHERYCSNCKTYHAEAGAGE